MKGKKKGKMNSKPGGKKTRKEKLNRPGATGYISRTQVTKRLQLSLYHFRQLCIYKGVHPVEPRLKRIRNMSHKTWYYLKDINFMKRDEVVNWFRAMKIYKKKVAYLKGVRRPAELAMLKSNKPTLDMDHFVRERYPTLQDAVSDLDDALSLICLFVEMQFGLTNKIMKKKQLAEIVRLKNEWQSYVVETHAMRKVFVSIKGVYYQAEVMGSMVTWLVPHPQRIAVPAGVDVVTMCFFVEFYIATLSFIFYRLFTDKGLHYPPTIDTAMLANDQGVKSVKIDKIVTQAPKTEPIAKAVAPAPLTAAEKERIAFVNNKLAHIISVDAAQSAAKTEEVLPSTDVKEEPTDEEIPEEFRKVDEAAGENAEQYKRPASLFAGLKFLINREIPKAELRFMIRAFGGEDVTEYDISESDPSITHHIVDRDWDKSKILINREYIQPQWIFDSINAGLLLPYHEYAHDATLPPHVSPFVNNVLKGYVPEQVQHLEELKSLEKKKKNGEEGDAKEKDDDGEEEDDKFIGEDDEDEDAATWESQYVKELAAEQEGRSYAGYVQDALGQTKLMNLDGDESDEELKAAFKKKKKTPQQIREEKETREDAEREDMSMDLLSSRQRKKVKSIKGRLERKKELNDSLMEKRKLIAKKKKIAAQEAAKAPPQEPSAPIAKKGEEKKRKERSDAPSEGSKKKKAKK